MALDLSFGKWLKQRRKSLDLTQLELAEQINCSVETMRKIEADVRRPSKQIAQRLAEVLNVAPKHWHLFTNFARGIHLSEADQALLDHPQHVSSAQIVDEQFVPTITPFVGRTDELMQIQAYLNNLDCRLITLIGMGGVGKTRLALRATETPLSIFPDGIFFVPLSNVDQESRLLVTIAETLGLIVSDTQHLLTRIYNYLRDKKHLLVLDNFEHLIGYAAILSDLLRQAPGVKLLVTSRQRLHLAEEWVLAIEGLPVPLITDSSDSGQTSAVEIFVNAAHRINNDFSLEDNWESVVQICQSVEGMPLALELAAGWLNLISCKVAAHRIAQDITFLSTGVQNISPRHRNMKTVFDQTWGLLSDEEKTALMFLSIFSGDFSLNAASFVSETKPETLHTLNEKSLLQSGASNRYRLHDLTRQYALRKLNEHNLVDLAAQRHYLFYFQFAEQLDIQSVGGSDQSFLIHAIEAEHDNIREALQWCTEKHDRATNGLRLAWVVWYFWDTCGYLEEGSQWYYLLLEHSESIPTDLLAKSYYVLGSLHVSRGALKEAEIELEKSLRCAEDSSNEWINAAATVMLARAKFESEDFINAKLLLDRGLSLARQLIDYGITARALLYYGNFCMATQDVVHALPLLKESESLYSQLNHLRGKSACLVSLGRAAILMENLNWALDLFHQGTDIARQINDRSRMSSSQCGLLCIALIQQKTELVNTLLAEVINLSRLTGQPDPFIALQKIADLILMQGQHYLAQQIYKLCQYAFVEIGTVNLATIVARKLEQSISSKTM